MFLLHCPHPYLLQLSFCHYSFIITPHAQRERGKVIGLGVLIIYMCDRLGKKVHVSKFSLIFYFTL